jgi:hypothetical protein
MNVRFERTGEIRDVDLLGALVALWRDRASVTLEFTRGTKTAGFDISEGEIVASFSADPRFEAAAILVRAGKLPAAALERLAVPEGSDRAMAAMHSGALTKREWKWGEKIRAIEVLSDLLAWNDGRYIAEPDTRSVSGDFRLPIPRLLLELFLRSRDRALVDHQLGNPDAPLARSEDFDAQFSTFGLTADAESVVRLIDGRSTAREIGSKAPADAFAVEKLLAAFVTLGLLRPGDVPSDEGAGAAAAAPPASEGAPQPPGAEQTGTPEYFDAPMERPAEEPSTWPPTLHDLTELPESAPPEPVATPEDEVEAPSAGALDASKARALEAAPVHADLPTEVEPPWDTLEPGASEPILERVENPVDLAPRRGQGPLLIGVFFALAAGVAAVLFFRSRAGDSGAAPVQPAPTLAAPVPSQAPLPTEAPQPTQVPAPTPRPTARVAPTKPTRPAPGVGPAVVSAKAPTPAAAAAPERKPWLDRAEASRRRLASEPNTRYAVQLLLACEVSTLEGAFRHEQPAGSMWVLTTDHKGRTCFKVLWGRFGSPEEARRAKDRVPLHFVSSSNRPAVVAVR